VIFVLHAEVLNGGEGLLGFIVRLVDRIEDEIHKGEVYDADLLQESTWYKSARPTRRKVLTAALARPPRQEAKTGLHAKRVDVRDDASALAAVKLAYTPLAILIEDREADGTLIDIVVEELGSEELKALWRNGRAVAPPAFEFNTAGGLGSMPDRIARLAADAAAAGRALRLFVICDSDTRWPGDTGHRSLRDVERLRARCAEFAVTLHVLWKRCIENYIPDEVYEEARTESTRADEVERFDAWLRRTAVQRDHFPVKSGLSAEEREASIAAGLYEISEMADLRRLEKKLFPGRGRLLQMLVEGRRAMFTAEGLRTRDGRGELDALLDAIAREL
jgi:hypothetical protein